MPSIVVLEDNPDGKPQLVDTIDLEFIPKVNEVLRFRIPAAPDQVYVVRSIEHVIEKYHEGEGSGYATRLHEIICLTECLRGKR